MEFYASRFRERIAAKPEKSKSTNLAMEVMKAVMVDGDGKEIIMGVASWLVPTSGGEVEEQVGGDEKAGEKETGEVEGEEKKDSNGDEDLPNWPAGIGAARFMRDSSLEADVFKEKFTGKSGAGESSPQVFLDSPHISKPSFFSITARTHINHRTRLISRPSRSSTKGCWGFASELGTSQSRCCWSKGFCAVNSRG